MADKETEEMAVLRARVGILEEQVTGELGIISALQTMQRALQDVRDTLNRQALLIPIATAAITATIVALITKVIK
jgi:hypothetical protein